MNIRRRRHPRDRDATTYLQAIRTPADVIIATTAILACFAWPVAAQAPAGGGCLIGSGNPGATACDKEQAITSVTPESLSEIEQRIPPGSKVLITKTLPDAVTSQIASALSQELIKAGYQVLPKMNVSLGYPYVRGFKVEAPHMGYNNTEYYRVLVGDTHA